MKRTFPMLLVAVLSAVFFFGSCNLKSEGSKSENVAAPNMIYILADDLGWGDLGFLGQEKFSTPNIDRMAEQGMFFSQHYSGSTVCAPSRAVLFTGLHTGHAPIRGNKGMNGGGYPIADSIPMMSEMFREQGYVTGAFGKWGMGYPGSEGSPENRGFDEWYGYNSQSLAHNFYPEFLWHNNRKVIMEGNADGGTEQYSFDLIHDKAMDFLAAHKDTAFFMYLPYTIPHAELIVPHDSIFESFIGQYPETPWKGVDDGPRYRKGPYGSQEYPHAAFAAMVTRLDMAVGEILSKLEEYGIAEHTLVIFTSDNGTHMEGGADPEFFDSNGPFRGYKRDLYEGGIRVPTIAWWPGTVAADTVNTHVSAFWDMFPTFAELTGGTVPEGIDGISMVPALTGQGNQEEHARLYWEFHERGGRIALREGNWKAIRYNVSEAPNSRIELYNLEADPGETTNVVEEYPEVERRLDALLRTARTPHPVWEF
ncbi:MAG: arylsulfatase [Bacteroidales bacterium]|nr:arylsulfatase [Bacteroidales bacterium]MDT8432493.1 arylsulfatase [Bacteroidales bacterium]